MVKTTVAWIGVGTACVSVQVETTVFQSGFISIGTGQVCADRHIAVVSTDGRVDIEDRFIGTDPTVAAAARPLAQILPIGPKLVLEAKLVGVHARTTHRGEGRSVVRQSVKVAVKAPHAVGETAHLSGLCGCSPVGLCQGLARDVVVRASVIAVLVVVKANGLGVARCVSPLRRTVEHVFVGTGIKVIGFDTRAARIGGRPSTAAVLVGRMGATVVAAVPVAREIVVRGDLLVVDLAQLLVAAHQLTGGGVACGGPTARVGQLEQVTTCIKASGLHLRHGRIFVNDQELGLALGLDPQNVFVGAFGHAHIAVAPAVHIKVVHHLLGCTPGRSDGLVGLVHAFEGFLEHSVAVVKLEERHVAGVLEHGRALRVVQASELQVGGQVGVVVAWRIGA